MNKRQRKKQRKKILKTKKRAPYQERTIYYAKEAERMLKEGKSVLEVCRELQILQQKLQI